MKFDNSVSDSMAKKSNRRTQYLINKHRGGVINQKGNQYENFFALFKIIHYTNLFPNHLGTIKLSAQRKSFVEIEIETRIITTVTNARELLRDYRAILEDKIKADNLVRAKELLESINSEERERDLTMVEALKIVEECNTDNTD